MLFLMPEHYEELESYAICDRSRFVRDILTRFRLHDDYYHAEIDRNDYCILLLKIKGANPRSQLPSRMLELAQMQDVTFDKYFNDVREQANKYGLFKH